MNKTNIDYCGFPHARTHTHIPYGSALGLSAENLQFPINRYVLRSVDWLFLDLSRLIQQPFGGYGTPVFS